MDKKPSDFLEAGLIVGLHSFRGQVRVKHCCDSARFLQSFRELYLDSAGEHALTVESSHIHKDMFIAKFAGIDDEESAMKLKNRTLYIKKEDAPLEHGAVFFDDLIGLPAIDAVNGFCYGTVTDIIKIPVNDVYVVTTAEGAEVLVPAVSAFIKKIALGEAVYIAPIEGMFEQ